MVARAIPLCVAAAYEQFIAGESTLNLVYPQPDSDDPATHSPGTESGPINAGNKGMLLFLACRDRQRDHAYTIWQEVRKLKGAGDAFEYEAGGLLTDALWIQSVDSKDQPYTRSQLRDLDDNVAKAAINLRDALQRHDYFCNQSSAENWSDDHAKRIAEAMLGLNPQLFPHTRDRKGGGATVHHNPPLRFGGFCSKSALFYWVVTTLPTMEEMLEALAERAKHLSSKRFDARKTRRLTGEANDTRFIRLLLLSMIQRNPNAPATRIAKIISPIADKALGIDEGLEKRTFERCKKLALELQREYKLEMEWFGGVPGISPMRIALTSGRDVNVVRQEMSDFRMKK